MASIELTVKNESLANCELPEGGLVTAPVKELLAVKIKEVMAELRDPVNRIDCLTVSAKTGAKIEQVAAIRDAMRARVTAAVAPATIEEK